MFVLTRDSKAASAANAWKRQYRGDKGDRELIASRIRALGDIPNPDDVDAIIGNGSWTRCTCTECGRDVNAVIHFGDEPNYVSDTVYICLGCIKLAVVAFEAAQVCS